MKITIKDNITKKIEKSHIINNYSFFVIPTSNGKTTLLESIIYNLGASVKFYETLETETGNKKLPNMKYLLELKGISYERSKIKSENQIKIIDNEKKLNYKANKISNYKNYFLNYE
jgi:hypothetical protein